MTINSVNNKKPFYKSTFFWSSLALLVIVFISFIPVLWNDFVDYDDKKFIYGNQLIRDLNWESFKTIFTTSWQSPWYKPLVYLSWALEYKFFGLSPTVYHLNNLLLHLVNTIMVLLIARRIVNRLFPKFKYTDWVAILVAAMFSLNPLKVESIAWAVERKDVLFSMFYLASTWLYLVYLDKKKTKFMIGGAIFFILALLSKSMAITLPFMLFTFDYLYKRKLKLGIILEKYPFYIVLVFTLYMYGFVFDTDNPVNYAGPGTVGAEQQMNINRFDNTFDYVLYNVIFASYRMDVWMSRTVLPLKLSVVHALPNLYFEHKPSLANMVYPLILLLLIGGAIFLQIRYKQRTWLFGLGYFLLTMLPVLGMKIYESYLSDRYTYIPSIGLFFIIGIAAIYLVKHFPKIKYLTVVLFIGYLSYFAVTSFQRSKVWKNSISLFSDLIKKYPDLYFGYSSLGNSFLEINKPEQAILNYNKSLRLKPYQPFILNARGLAKHNLRDFDGAMADFNESIRMEPRILKAWNNRGNCYLMLRQFENAVKDYNEAIRLDPSYYVAYNGRGMAYHSMQEYEKAIEDFNRCLSMNPNYFLALSNRANALAMLKRYDEAIADYNRVIRINPNYVTAYHGRGFARLNKNDLAGALEDFNITIQKSPNHSLAYFNRGVTKLKVNDLAGACADWNQSANLGYEPAISYIQQYCK